VHHVRQPDRAWCHPQARPVPGEPLRGLHDRLSVGQPAADWLVRAVTVSGVHPPAEQYPILAHQQQVHIDDHLHLMHG
jgi:hypothetical protein